MNLALADVRFLVDRKRTYKNQHSPAGRCAIARQRPIVLTRRTSLEQKPRPPVGLVDPDLQPAGCCYVAALVANTMCFAQARGKLFIVITQLCEHILWRNVIGIVVEQPLQAVNMTDRPQRCATDFPHAFCDRVCRSKNLVPLARRAVGDNHGSAAPKCASGSSSSSSR